MAILAEPTGPHRQIALPDVAEVQLLAVHPHAPGQGLGKRLVASCEGRARARGYARMVLSTQPAMVAASSSMNSQATCATRRGTGNGLMAAASWSTRSASSNGRRSEAQVPCPRPGHGGLRRLLPAPCS